MESISPNPGTPPAPSTRRRYRVLHTADWHLGKALCDHDRTAEHAAFLDWLLRTIAQEKADALVVSGDVFDSANPPQAAQRLYYNFLGELHRLGHCTAVITAGNHDSPTYLEAPRHVLRALDVHIVGIHDCEKALIPLPDAENPCVVLAAVPFLRDRDLRTGVLGQSAAEIQADLHRGLRGCYARVAAGAAHWYARGVPILATGHLTMLGGDETESERPIHIGGLGSIGPDLFAETFCYGALGHLHRPQAIGEKGRLRYAGSPIALSFGEAADHKEIRLLDFQDGALVENARISVPAPRQIARLRVARADLESCLLSFQPAAGPLPPWLEIVVENPPPGENLYEVVQGIAKDHPCRVLKVTAAHGAGVLALGLRPEEGEVEAGDILSDPPRVFARQLDGLPDLPAADREALEMAFAELHGLVLDDERGGLPAAVAAPAPAPRDGGFALDAGL